MPEIDFGEYVRAPRFGAFTGLALSIRMLNAAPDELPEPVFTALMGLREAAEDLQSALRSQHALRTTDARPADQRFDGAWAGLHGRLVAWARQIGEPEAERADELLRSVFPSGLVFLKAAFDEEWIHSRTLLQHIEDEKLVEAIDELAGPRFLEMVRESHDRLGEVLGLGANPEPSEPRPAVGEKVRALAKAIAEYGRRFVGIVNIDEEASVEMFLTAMAPRDAHRDKYRRAPGDAADKDETQEEELDLDAPLPPLPEPEA